MKTLRFLKWFVCWEDDGKLFVWLAKYPRTASAENPHIWLWGSSKSYTRYVQAKLAVLDRLALDFEPTVCRAGCVQPNSSVKGQFVYHDGLAKVGSNSPRVSYAG